MAQLCQTQGAHITCPAVSKRGTPGDFPDMTEDEPEYSIVDASELDELDDEIGQDLISLRDHYAELRAELDGGGELEEPVVERLIASLSRARGFADNLEDNEFLHKVALEIRSHADYLLPRLKDPDNWRYYCDTCDTSASKGDDYCRSCGVSFKATTAELTHPVSNRSVVPKGPDIIDTCILLGGAVGLGMLLANSTMYGVLTILFCSVMAIYRSFPDAVFARG